MVLSPAFPAEASDWPAGTTSLIPLNPFNPHLRGFEREAEVLTSREGVTRTA
jgi:hypothetical protein